MRFKGSLDCFSIPALTGATLAFMVLSALAGCKDPYDVAASSAKPAATQGWVPIPGMPDLTKVDVTKDPSFRGRQASIYGIRFGMNEEEVRAACKAHGLTPRKEMRRATGVTTQLAIFDDKTNEQLMNVLWRPNASGVDEIVVFPVTAPRLAGDLQKLFTEDTLDGDSALRKDFLGDAPGIPQKETFIDIEIERHRFAKRDIEVIVLYAEGGKAIQFSLRRL